MPLPTVVPQVAPSLPPLSVLQDVQANVSRLVLAALPLTDDFDLSVIESSITKAPGLTPLTENRNSGQKARKPNKQRGRPLSKRTTFMRTINVLNERRAPVPATGSLVPKTSLRQSLSESLKTTEERVIAKTRHVMKPWEKLTEEQRSLPIMMEMMNRGNAYAFSLNLSRDVMAKAELLLKQKARDYIRDRLARELRALSSDASPFIMIMERDTGGRLHLHGTIQSPAHGVAAIKAALRRAGGCWDGLAGSKFQAKVTPLKAVGCWHSYVTKQLRRFSDRGVKQHLSISHSARRLGRELYEQLRRTPMGENRVRRTLH